MKNRTERRFVVSGTLFAATAGSIGILLSAVSIAAMLADVWDNEFLTASWQWLGLLAALAFGWVGFQSARLWIIWRQLKLARVIETRTRSAPERRTLRRGFFELFIYFIVSLFGLALVAFLSTEGSFGQNAVHLGRTASATAAPLHVAVFLGFFAMAFVPLLFAFSLQATADARERQQPLLRDDVIPPLTLLMMALGMLFVLLMTWAASVKLISSNADFGVLITSIVILLFVAVIVAPHVARRFNSNDEALDELRAKIQQQSMVPVRSPAILVSRLDSILVRIIAPFSGATQIGRALPHLLLCAIMLLLSALGYVLASPYGIIPIAVAMLIALALGRRWAWLEEDRETASRLQTTRSRDIYVGFDNDLKDEALLGYAWLFILVPLALNQIQDWTHSFAAVPGASSGNAFVDWLRFFGVEIAKAVPFVDVWETYNGQVSTPFDSAEPLANHLIVAARMLVNLVIVSALIQALGISQRAQTQNRLYDAGQIEHFDPFTEAEFFDRGIQSRGQSAGSPKKKFEERIQRHVESRRELGHAPLPYSQRRLAELIGSETADLRNGADWMIKQYGVLAGLPREQLGQLHNRWTLFKLPQLAAFGRPQDKNLILGEKLEFERVLASLKDVSDTLDDDDVGKLLRLLEDVKGSPDFEYSQTLAYELLGRLKSPAAVVALALHVIDGDHYQAKPEWRERSKAFGGLHRPLFLRKAGERMKIYDALKDIGICRTTDADARDLALELLEWMGSTDGGDRATPSQQRAAECAREVRRGSQPSST